MCYPSDTQLCEVCRQQVSERVHEGSGACLWCCDQEVGEIALDRFETKWGEKYPIVIKFWRDNWDRFSKFFQYTEPIRRLIYTTDTVEGYHCQIRKVTKDKGIFPNDTTLSKLVYLAYRNVCKKWTIPIPNWGIISQ